MINFKQFFRENVFKASSSFVDLPDTAPHGFWVKGGKFIPVKLLSNIGGFKMGAHDMAIKELYPEIHNAAINDRKEPGSPGYQMAVLRNGFIRVGKTESGKYELTYIPFKVSRSDIKLAKDIAQHYNIDVVDHFEKAME